MNKRVRAYALSIIGLILLSYLFFSFFRSNPNVYTDSKATGLDSEFNSLVWSDEFDGEGAINQEKWFHQTQLPPGGSWWGGIIQHYTDREANSYLKDDYLNLVAKKETFDDQGEIKQYTAARLNSKFAFTYGRIEIRAKLPTGTGTWPAIWMLNTNIDEDGAYWDNQGLGTTKWPSCGEIDILEHWGKNQDYVSSALHNASSYGDQVKNVGGQKIDDASAKFHDYSFEWSEEKMIFSVDGVEHFRYQPTIKNADTWPYDSDYYLILNIAIEPGIDPDFVESSMVVDYIRIYQ
ncbi:glycoside hydrolase family 16 protein [Spongiivirga citrea]|uniref:Family 16 glycosylhydrolase n=1 Tax=Spongiivirga citrea TaxID=1481457 RepID=A0A6M0CUW8_9FLAO|nr:glycoside hydrolase family 16 protein [Spongiivirga citrea]NER17580.1 family 16 glycosylhydrolase [Spongiivirga citrea]